MNTQKVNDTSESTWTPAGTGDWKVKSIREIINFLGDEEGLDLPVHTTLKVMKSESRRNCTTNILNTASIIVGYARTFMQPEAISLALGCKVGYVYRKYKRHKRMIETNAKYARICIDLDKYFGGGKVV